MTIATMLFGVLVFSPIVGFGLGALVDSTIMGAKRSQFRRAVIAYTEAESGYCYCMPSRNSGLTSSDQNEIAELEAARMEQVRVQRERMQREQDYLIAQRNRQEQMETIGQGKPLRGVPLYPLPQPAQLPPPNTVAIPQPHRDVVEAQSQDGIYWFTVER